MKIFGGILPFVGFTLERLSPAELKKYPWAEKYETAQTLVKERTVIEYAIAHYLVAEWFNRGIGFVTSVDFFVTEEDK